MADGLYHQNRLAVAPNGSISYINDVSASIHPITQRIEERQEKKIGKIYYPAAGLATETIPFYKSAYDMDMRKVIDVYLCRNRTRRPRVVAHSFPSRRASKRTL